MKQSEKDILILNERKKLNISQAASDMINGFKKRYGSKNDDRRKEFSKHEEKFRNILSNNDLRSDKRNEMANAFVDCLLDDFREVTIGSLHPYTHVICINDVLATIDGQGIEREIPIDRDVYNIARATCTHYIIGYTELPTNKKDTDGPKYGDFLIAIGTLRYLNQFRTLDNI